MLRTSAPVQFQSESNGQKLHWNSFRFCWASIVFSWWFLISSGFRDLWTGCRCTVLSSDMLKASIFSCEAAALYLIISLTHWLTHWLTHSQSFKILLAYLDFNGLIYLRYFMGILWVSHWYLMGISWVSHRYLMGISWVSRGYLNGI